MELFKLFGSILINSDEADKSLQKTDDHAEKVGGTLGKSIGTAAKWGLGLTSAAGAAAGALFGMATKASSAAAEIDDIAQRTNLSAKTLQEYKHAADMSGIGIEAIEGSAKKLTLTLGKFGNGNKEVVATFKQLGIEAEGSNGKLKSTDELYPQIIAKLADMKDITERNNLAVQIFGKSAMDMAPMLNGGAEGVKQLTDEAHKMGLVMSDESVAAGAKFDDTLTVVKSSLGALTNKIMAEAMPIAQKMMDWVMVNMPTIQAVAKTAFDIISTVVKVASDIISNVLMPAFSALWAWIEPNIPAIKKIIEDTFNGIKEIMDGTTMVIKSIWEKYGADIMKYTKLIWDAILLIFKVVFETIKNLFNVFAGVFTGDWNRVWNAIKNQFILIWDSVKEYFSILWKALGVIVDVGLKIIKSTIESIMKGISKFINGIIDGIADSFKGMVNGVIGGLNFMINALNKLKFKVPDWVPGIGGEGFGFSIPNIPSFSIGTRYLPSDMLIQAHKGEMIVPESENPYANSGGNIIDKPSKTPITLQLILQNGKVIAEYILDDLDSLIGNKNKLTGRSVGI